MFVVVVVAGLGELLLDILPAWRRVWGALEGRTRGESQII